MRRSINAHGVTGFYIADFSLGFLVSFQKPVSAYTWTKAKNIQQANAYNHMSTKFSKLFAISDLIQGCPTLGM